MPDDTLEALLRRGRVVAHAPDAVILHKGPVARSEPLHFYVVTDGRVSVRDGRRIIAKLLKADTFGEWGISHQRGFRVADVMADGPSQTIRFDEDTYRWLVERHPWQLACATVFLGAAMLTKRDGQLLAACVLVGALVASWRWKRAAWPRLALVGGVALAVALPWRLWYTSHDLTGEFPENGLLGLADTADRFWPALRSVVTTLVDYDLWLLVLPLAGAAIVLAFLGGARVLPGYAALVYGLGERSWRILATVPLLSAIALAILIGRPAI